MDNVAGPIVLVGYVALGVALLWARHLAYRNQPNSGDDTFKLLMSIAAWICILTGILGSLIQSLYILSPFGVVVFAIVAVLVMTQYRASERRALLRLLSVAAERGIPLNEAARGFGQERTDELGLQAMRLAQLLEQGWTLPDALRRSGTRLPTDALLAIRVGSETGALREAIRRIERPGEATDRLVQTTLNRLQYVAAVLVVLVGILTFMMLKIVPVMEMMFQEFGMQLPTVTLALIAISTELFRWGLIVMVPLGMLLLGVILLVVNVLHYLNLLPRSIPLVHRLSLPWDSALIMRVLALAVHSQWPLDKTIWFLSRAYPVFAVRKRLSRAGRLINDGVPWTDSLRRVRLLRQPEWAVLQAASRVGNLEWALEEMAESSLRRLAYRLQLATNTLFPLAILGLGLTTGFVVVALFLPLVSMITHLV